MSTSATRSLFATEPMSGEVTASGQYLEQLSDEQFWQFAHELAYRTTTTAQTQEYLTCMLSQGNCLIPLSELYTIVRPPHLIALLPAIPSWMPGIVAWRGETIAVIDLESFLSGTRCQLHHEALLLITKQKDVALGLLVPAIGQTLLEQSAGNMAEVAAQSATTPVSLEHIQHIAPWYLPSQASCVKSLRADALVLDLPVLRTSALQQIEIATSNG